MRKKFKVLILGKGRIGKAVFHYLKKLKVTKNVAFFSNEREIKKSDILIGALPGKIGEKSLRLALQHKKDLIDISDLEIDFYLKKKKEIEKRKILVVPNCGFCPGLVNLILGHEIKKQKEIEKIEIEAGSLSPKKFFFPFLWCFEDLILEHQIFSLQKISGKKVKLPPFSGKREEKFFGILAETYFAPSGFEYLIDSLKVKDFQYRNIRPLGFFYFFQFLKKYGFLKKENLKFTKKVLESQKEDNLTLAQVKIFAKNKKIIWKIKSFSKKREKLNSMQKITSFLPAILAKFIFENEIKEKGIFFLEKMGEKDDLFNKILKGFKNEGILIKRMQNEV